MVCVGKFLCGVFFLSIQGLNIYTLNSLKDACFFTLNRRGGG